MGLPSGVVTFLMTDIEGSTRLWDEAPDAMRAGLARHDAITATVVDEHAGFLVKSRGEGDSTFSVFRRPTDAITAACALQTALTAEPWPQGADLRVRIAVHTGEADLGVDDYYGVAVNRCARLRTIAHGGQALVSQATAGLVRQVLPEGVSLRDLGYQRLRDLAEPERVSQLLHPSLPADFPALRTIDLVPNNLPYQVSAFVGREAEMTKIRELLRETRLLTLTGAGGIGKTRLAVQAAAEMLYEYPDGVWLVDLSALADGGLVPQTVATALGVREEPGRPLLEAVARAMRQKTALLLLDNCEHLVAATAEIAEALLRQCSRLRVLATSREALRAEGETVWRVPSLSVPHRETGMRPLPVQLTQYAAVRLFMDRAGKANPGLAMTDENAPAVAGICSRLDGIPLAVELAAARAGVMTPEQIEERLDERFRLLTGGRRTATPRHQTLQATVDWSYQLLSDPEKRLFARLSVFVGGFTLEAAEAVCAGDGIETWQVPELLGELVSKSLVIPGTARYWMLETLRDYGRRSVEETDGAADLHQRHAHHYTELAESVGRRLDEGWEPAWLDQLEAERDNWRMAARWYLADDARVEEGLRLAAALGSFFLFRGAGSEGRRLLEALLSRATQRTAARAEALCALGRMTRDVTAAGQLLDESLALTRELGTPRDLARVLFFRARSGESLGPQGAAMFEQSLAISREVGDKRGIARALVGLAFETSESDLGATRAMLEESLSLWRELGDRQAMAETLIHLGWVVDRQGDRELARRIREESLGHARAAGDRRAVHYAAWRLGFAALDRGDAAAARSYGEESVAAGRQLGEQLILIDALMHAGYFAQRDRDAAAARAHYHEALSIAREVGSDEGIAAALCRLGCIAEDLGERRALLEEACALHARCGIKASFAEVALADTARLEGDHAQAEALLRKSLRAAVDRGHHFLCMYALRVCGDLAEEQGNARRAVRLWSAADHVGEDVGWAYAGIERWRPEECTGCLAVLGDEDFAAAMAEGSGMTWREAAAYALEEEPGASAGHAGAPPKQE